MYVPDRLILRRVLLKLVLGFIGTVSSPLFGQAREPVLHFITLSNTNCPASVAEKAGTPNQIGAAEITFASDVESMVGIFMANIAPSQLRVYCFVTDTNSDIAKLFHPFFFRPLTAEEKKEQGCEDCQYWVQCSKDFRHTGKGSFHTDTDPAANLKYLNYDDHWEEYITSPDESLLDVQEDDVIVFYYSGHGKIRNNKLYYNLTDHVVKDKDKIVKALSKFKPANIFIFSDCCSTIGEIPCMAEYCFPVCPGSVTTSEQFNALFFQANIPGGIVDICASRPGEEALGFTFPLSSSEENWWSGRTGGLFTVSLVETLGLPLQTKTWPAAFDKLTRNCDEFFQAERDAVRSLPAEKRGPYQERFLKKTDHRPYLAAPPSWDE